MKGVTRVKIYYLRSLFHTFSVTFNFAKTGIHFYLHPIAEMMIPGRHRLVRVQFCGRVAVQRRDQKIRVDLGNRAELAFHFRRVFRRRDLNRRRRVDQQ